MLRFSLVLKFLKNIKFNNLDFKIGIFNKDVF